MAKSHSYKANVWIYIHIDKRFTHIFVTEKSGIGIPMPLIFNA